MRKNMTIKEMEKQVRRNYNEALNTGYLIIKDHPSEEDYLVLLKNDAYGDVQKFLNSAQVNYIRKAEMKRILDLSEKFKNHLKDIRQIHHSLKA